jgi:outer membrane protein assembly factor BamB
MTRRNPLSLASVPITGLALLAGCAGGELPEPSPLPELDSQGIKVERIWRRDAGKGGASQETGLVAAIDGRRVYTAHSDGGVSAIDLETGERVWRRRTDLKLSAGPAVARNLVIVGARDGLLVAFSSEDGSEIWRRFMSSEVLSAPVVGEDNVLVRTLDGQLAAFGAEDGARRWTVEHSVPTLTSRGTSRPVIAEGTVYAGMDNGKLVAYNVTTGERRWEQIVAAPTGRSELERIVDIDAELLVAENEIYAASAGGKTASLSRASGRLRWQRDIASRTGLTFRDGQVFVSDVDGSVWSIERSSGAALWKQDALAHRRLSAPAVHGGYVLVGDFEGYLHWLAPEDGTVVARAHPVGDAIVGAPIAIGDRVLVLSATGELAVIEVSSKDSEK